MRLSFRRIVIRNSQKTYRICDGSPFHLNQHVTKLQYSSYSDLVKNSDPPQGSNDVESTNTVPDELDTMAAESSKEQPPSSPPSPSTHTPQGKQAVRYRMPNTNSFRDHHELQNFMSKTSLRKRIGWFNPLKGVNPAYDMALEFLDQDRQQKIEAIQRLERRIALEIQRGASTDLIQKLENARYQLLVLRDINVPEIRWRFKQGDIDLRLPAHRYLYKQNWVKGVYVGRLMQRINTMKIIPDSIPSLTPKVEFRLRFQEMKFPSRVRPREEGWRDTEAGELLSSATLRYPPRMEIIPHYKEWWMSRRYTVVMLDLDVPDVENDSYTTKLHWMVKDIIASPVDTIIREGNGKIVVPYLPPHPYRGMKYHRYPIFVFEQPSNEWTHRQHLRQQNRRLSQLHTESTTNTETLPLSPLLTVPSTVGTSLRTYVTAAHDPDSESIDDAFDDINGDTFNIRSWATRNGMKPVGAHLVRCIWDTNVPEILQSLGLKERAFKKIRSEETSPLDFA